jgi:hypothetical protein
MRYILSEFPFIFYLLSDRVVQTEKAIKYSILILNFI